PGRRGRRRPRRASRARGRGSGGKLPPAAPGAPRARSYTRWRGARRDRDGRERARLRRRRQHEREQAAAAGIVVVTGGLGGTPDDVTREAIAVAFGVPQVEQPDVAARLRERFQRDPEYVSRWAQLPEGSRALENPLGGAPGFAI